MSSSSDARRAFQSTLAQLDFPRSDDPFVIAGQQMGIGFALFAEWVAERVKESKVDSVFLLSREGPFLEAVLRRCGLSLPNIEVLEVSRVSTFLPSMPDFSTPTMMRMWERFPLQSPASMLAGIGLSAEMFSELLDQFELDPAGQIHQPWSDRRITSFLEHPGFTERATAERDAARELVLGYLEQKGYLESRSAALVDVGWRGTIQDSLARLVPSVRSHGLLLAHRPADLPQYANTSKAGFIAGADERGELFGQETRLAASPLEMFCTTQGGSSIAYERTAGEVAVVRRPVESEEVLLRTKIRRFQSAVLEATDEGAGSVPASAAVERQAIARASLKSVLFDPDPAIVEAFEAYQLDPSMGDAGQHSDPGISARQMLSPAGRHSAKERMQRHGWPHAILKRSMGERAYSAALTSAQFAGERGRWLI